MLNVAVGVILNNRGEVLISQRDKCVDQGGLWEFPGGKLEPGENTYQALKRELFEELGIKVNSAQSLIKINHQYPTIEVSLDVMTVTSYKGSAIGVEGQAIRWVPIAALKNYAFPDANSAIISALQLPDCYPIVDGSIMGSENALELLDDLTSRGFSVIQFRAKNLPKPEFEALARKVIKRCEAIGVRLYLNCDLQTAVKLGASCVHLSSKYATELSDSSNSCGLSIAVSCHTAEDIERAKKIGADFVVLSPVCKTLSHPDAVPLGWGCFKKLINGVGLPVYALGGLSERDVGKAKAYGAQGVSGIRGFVS